MFVVTLADLRYKEIINLQNGHRLGYVCDAEITLPDGEVRALIVPGASRFFGILGREEDMVIPWEKITKIGEDIILVDMEMDLRRHEYRTPAKKRLF